MHFVDNDGFLLNYVNSSWNIIDLFSNQNYSLKWLYIKVTAYLTNNNLLFMF